MSESEFIDEERLRASDEFFHVDDTAQSSTANIVPLECEVEESKGIKTFSFWSFIDPLDHFHYSGTPSSSKRKCIYNRISLRRYLCMDQSLYNTRVSYS